jgi:hypothetical protein
MKLAPQQPATGISLDSEFDDAKIYTVNCDCHSSNHSVNMWIEVAGDQDSKQVEVSFFVKTSTPFINRLRVLWSILTTGVYFQEHQLVLNKQAALNLSTAISKTVKELEK